MYDLTRFIQPHQRDFDQALSEIRNERKENHWMWYIFPQLQGLSQNPSPYAERFAIRSLEEAIAYLNDPLLGRNMLLLTDALMDTSSSNPVYIFGYIDALKLRSSMTLFAVASDYDPAFTDVLDKFFEGKPDELTLRLLHIDP